MSPRLAGRRVLVTRTRERAAGLVDRLHAEAADAIVVPLITTRVLADPASVTAAAGALMAAPGSRWVVFTSATAARLVLGVVTADVLSGASIAAVGAETAGAVAAQGAVPALVGEDATAAALARALAAVGMLGARVWFPAAEGADTALEEALREAGATVDRLTLYRSEMPEAAPERLAAAFSDPRGVDAVTLASGSAARHLAAARAGAPLPHSVRVVACIGESTAAAAVEAGLPRVVTAPEPSVAGLVEVLVERLASAQPLP